MLTFRREILKAGTEFKMPPDGAVCHLHVLDDPHKIFPEQHVSLTLGMAETHERLVLDESIMKMMVGEEARIEIFNRDCSRGDSTSNKVITLKLKDFTGPQIFEMNKEDKWRLAKCHKDTGVHLFSKGELDLAFQQFSVALKYIISLTHHVPECEHNKQEMNINELRMVLYLNLSACQLKVRNYKFAAENASKALSICPNNPKGLYRRGAALLHLQEYERSLVDLNAARELEPQNVQIQNSLRELHSQMKKLDHKYANAMKKMFQ